MSPQGSDDEPKLTPDDAAKEKPAETEAEVKPEAPGAPQAGGPSAAETEVEKPSKEEEPPEEEEEEEPKIVVQTAIYDILVVLAAILMAVAVAFTYLALQRYKTPVGSVSAVAAPPKKAVQPKAEEPPAPAEGAPAPAEKAKPAEGAAPAPPAPAPAPAAEKPAEIPPAAAPK